jgi:hypothetical protein
MDISNILTDQQRAAGLTLEEDTDVAVLSQDRHVVRPFTRHATADSIQAEADWWAERKGANRDN